MDDFDELDDQPDTWATRTVAAIDLSRTISTLLLIGASVALACGVVAAIATYTSADGFGGASVEDGIELLSAQRRMLISQSLSIFVSALLPAGLLAAAAAALRLQASRTEAHPALD